MARDERGEVHHWCSKGLGATVSFDWDTPIAISQIEVKCDTNVKKNIMMLKNTRENEAYTTQIPVELLKCLTLELNVDGVWNTICEKDDNQRRLIKFHFEEQKINGFRLTFKETYGAKNVKLFEVRCYQ